MKKNDKVLSGEIKPNVDIDHKKLVLEQLKICSSDLAFCVAHGSKLPSKIIAGFVADLIDLESLLEITNRIDQKKLVEVSTFFDYHCRFKQEPDHIGVVKTCGMSTMIDGRPFSITHDGETKAVIPGEIVLRHSFSPGDLQYFLTVFKEFKKLIREAGLVDIDAHKKERKRRF